MGGGYETELEWEGVARSKYSTKYSFPGCKVR